MHTEPDLRALADGAIDAALAAGASDAEAYVEHTRTTTIQLAGEEAGTEVKVETGLGLRVLVGGRLGFLATAPCSAKAIAGAAARAVARARRGTAVPAGTLPAATMTIPVEALALLDAALIGTPLAWKLDLLRGEAASARAGADLARADFRYEDRVSEIHLASTRGVRVAYTAGKLGIAGLVAATGNAEAWAAGRRSSRRLADLATAGLGPALATRAMALRDAGMFPQKQGPARAAMTVVFPPDIAADLLAALAQALSGSNIARKTSFLAGRLGERVGNDLWNVIDDGTLPGGLGSAPADDEGTPCAYHHPLVGGRLAGFLADATAAARLGTRSTGNAVRASFRSPPAIGPRNLILTPGHLTPAEIMATIPRGFLLLRAARERPLDLRSGSYVLRAAGQLIVDGMPGPAVAGVLVAGRLPDMLRELTALGHDLAWDGSIAAPTLAIAGMRVAPGSPPPAPSNLIRPRKGGRHAKHIDSPKSPARHGRLGDIAATRTPDGDSHPPLRVRARRWTGLAEPE